MLGENCQIFPREYLAPQPLHARRTSESLKDNIDGFVPIHHAYVSLQRNAPNLSKRPLALKQKRLPDDETDLLYARLGFPIHLDANQADIKRYRKANRAEVRSLFGKFLTPPTSFPVQFLYVFDLNHPVPMLEHARLPYLALTITPLPATYYPNVQRHSSGGRWRNRDHLRQVYLDLYLPLPPKLGYRNNNARL